MCSGWGSRITPPCDFAHSAVVCCLALDLEFPAMPGAFCSLCSDRFLAVVLEFSCAFACSVVTCYLVVDLELTL